MITIKTKKKVKKLTYPESAKKKHRRILKKVKKAAGLKDHIRFSREYGDCGGWELDKQGMVVIMPFYKKSASEFTQTEAVTFRLCCFGGYPWDVAIPELCERFESYDFESIAVYSAIFLRKCILLQQIGKLHEWNYNRTLSEKWSWNM